jgi:ribosomal protein L2
MALKTYKPTSPGRRTLVTVINDELSKERPVKGLVRTLNRPVAAITTVGSPPVTRVAAISASTG